jgi:hypothetical protein
MTDDDDTAKLLLPPRDPVRDRHAGGTFVHTIPA